MPEEIVMPRLSDTMSEGTIARWLKKEGDAVKTGEALMEVETDKATLELQSYHDGTLVKILIGDGGTAPIGTPVGVLAKGGETVDLSQYGGGQGAAAPAAPAAPASPAPAPAPAAAAAPVQAEQPPTPPGSAGVSPAPAAQAPTSSASPGAQSAPAAANGADVKASPLARVMAEQAGLDLRALAGRGSGPGGRIVRQDVESAVKEGVRAPAAASPAAQAGPSGAAYEDRELNRVRQAIARNLALSKPGAPHIYLTMDMEMDAAMALRKQLNDLVEDDASKISVNDIVLKAVALALRKYPDLNAHFQDGKPPALRIFSNINLTVAVPGEQGLMVPVVKDVDRKPVSQIAREAKELYGRVQGGKPGPDDFSGGTFAVSNLGRWGIDEFQAVINPPQVGILAVGAATPKPVVRDGKVEVRTIMRVTISADHRAVDGVYAADFLVELKRLLERPLSLVI
jgi:pyruvate dehydrogenase E2 component (dihydrolipoamide acetyltransferase)